MRDANKARTDGNVAERQGSEAVTHAAFPALPPGRSLATLPVRALEARGLWPRQPCLSVTLAIWLEAPSELDPIGFLVAAQPA